MEYKDIRNLSDEDQHKIYTRYMIDKLVEFGFDASTFLEEAETGECIDITA